MNKYIFILICQIVNKPTTHTHDREKKNIHIIEISLHTHPKTQGKAKERKKQKQKQRGTNTGERDGQTEGCTLILKSLKHKKKSYVI